MQRKPQDYQKASLNRFFLVELLVSVLPEACVSGARCLFRTVHSCSDAG